MGGFGSGATNHWWRPARKRIVEECYSISISELVRHGFLRIGESKAGSWTWTRWAEVSFSTTFEANVIDPASPFVQLTHIVISQPATYRIRLTTTSPRFGGSRFWFACPLLVNGRPCGRRVGKLYHPPFARYFGCRVCHQLTYRSCQESHKHDRRRRFMAKLLGADAELLALFFSGRRRSL